MVLTVQNYYGLGPRAVEAGATVKMPVRDMFWGDRYGLIEDPFGHLWSVATPQRAPMSAEELAAAAREAFSKAGCGS